MHLSNLRELFREVVEKIPYGIGEGIGTAAGSRIFQFMIKKFGVSNKERDQQLVQELRETKKAIEEIYRAFKKKEEEKLLFRVIALLLVGAAAGVAAVLLPQLPYHLSSYLHFCLAITGVIAFLKLNLLQKEGQI